MLNTFWQLLFSNVGYQLVGVAICFPLEWRLARAKVSFAERMHGLQFLLVGAVAMAITGVALEWLRVALHIRPLVSFHSPLGAPVIAAVALGLFQSLQFYIVHRLQHRFFWRFHAVHHSIRQLSAANSYHHWTEPLMGLTVAIPLLFVDVQIAPTLAILTMALSLQHFYVHSAVEPHFGPLRWVLVDNRYHRIHHSLDREHHDKNFGAMSPLWDWLFGTMYMPERDEWPDVGLAEMPEPRTLGEWSSAPWRLQSGRVLRKPRFSQ